MKNGFNIFSFLTPKASTQFLLDSFTIRQALEKFDQYKYGVLPVLDKEGKYLTSISEGDVLRYIKNIHNFDIKVAESRLISEVDHYRPYQSLDINCQLNEVFALSQNQNFIPIVDDRNIFIGIVRRSGIISYMMENYLKRD